MSGRETTVSACKIILRGRNDVLDLLGVSEQIKRMRESQSHRPNQGCCLPTPYCSPINFLDCLRGDSGGGTIRGGVHSSVLEVGDQPFGFFRIASPSLSTDLVQSCTPAPANVFGVSKHHTRTLICSVPGGIINMPSERLIL